jgi:hypothetical protein
VCERPGAEPGVAAVRGSGVAKVKAVALWFAVAHNLACGVRLRAAQVAV